MARARTYPVVATVIGRVKLGEADLILTLLSSDGSLVRAVAKGARKPTGKLAGRTQLFSEGKYLIAKGRTLDVVCEASLTDARAKIAYDPDASEAAAAICSVTRLVSFEESPDPYLYGLFARSLLALAQVQELEGEGERQALLFEVVAAYTFKALSHEGWRPETSNCIECGDEQVTRFSVAAGGALCESCARDVAGAQLADPALLGWIEALVSFTFDDLLAQPASLDTACLLLEQAHLWAATHLDARLKAFEFLRGV